MKLILIAVLCAAACSAQKTITVMRDNRAYDSGTRDLDAKRYDDAIREFDIAIVSKSPRSDGAMYWKAYTLNILGKRDEALAAIAALRRDYPSSAWLNDAQALEAEVRTRAGQPLAPADEANEDLKLMAINSLMNADPERAIPLLEGILKGTGSRKLKNRALFVLTQNRSARAQQVLADYAKGAGNPDLQREAIQYIGMAGTATAQQQLAAIYAASSDVQTKREIIRSLMVARGKDQIFDIAKSDKDDTLRVEAIRQLGALRALDQLSQLDSDAKTEIRLEVLRALFVGGGSDRLAGIAKADKDPKVRAEAIRQLSNSNRISTELLASLYAGETDAGLRNEIVNGLASRHDAKTLIELARKEQDPGMKRRIVSRLAEMRNSKEATDYMMELLK